VAEGPMGARWRKLRVREFMSTAGYKTIEALADELGVSRQALTTAINGHSQPTLALTLAVANALNVPVEEFAERTPELAFPKGQGRSSSQREPLMTAPLLAISA
jgi:transcriptional regulator with XRE-family HTH domain